MARTIPECSDDLQFASLAYGELETAIETALLERHKLTGARRYERAHNLTPAGQFAEAVLDELAEAKARIDALLPKLAMAQAADEAADDAEEAAAEESDDMRRANALEPGFRRVG